jgi:hypothetical protein
MLTWGSGVLVHDQLAEFDDTIGSLIRIFLRHPDSPYDNLRHNVQVTYSRRMSYIDRDFGHKRVSALTISDFKEMHKFWLAPKVPNEKRRVSHAHEQMVFVRQLFRFGKALKLPGCRDAKDILDEMEFPNVRRRTTIIDNDQAVLIRAEAHRRCLPSIALAQAFQPVLPFARRTPSASGFRFPILACQRFMMASGSGSSASVGKKSAKTSGWRIGSANPSGDGGTGADGLCETC